jgi:antirestriction protein ArdC
MPSQNDIRQAITNQIIESLEKGGVPPWKKPWRIGSNSGAPCSVQSKRPYRGLNSLLLSLHAERHGLISKYFGTWRAWKALGGNVLRRPPDVPEGEWACRIVYWSPVETKPVKNVQGENEPQRWCVLRHFSVFGLDQVDAPHLDHLRADQADIPDPLTANYQPAEVALEAAIGGMGVSLRYGGSKAYYAPPPLDSITLPPKASFVSLNEYYNTAFHECVHATGHPERLDWSRKNRHNAYALGELIAELGGVFVCRELDVPASEDLSNHTSYLGSWLQGMKGDSRFIIMAASQASKAASYILGFSRKPEDVPEEEGELAMT